MYVGKKVTRVDAYDKVITLYNCQRTCSFY